MVKLKISAEKEKINNEMVGKKFGRLTVLENVGIIHKKTHFKCECVCGNFTFIRGYSLRAGITKSCGCLQKDIASSQGLKHGMSKTDIYKTWQNMLSRCYDPKDHSYKNYGGRGITVCQGWRDSFENFYRDMGERPKDLTIERINNDLGYFKENCRWATRAEQIHNQRLRKNNKTGVNGVYLNSTGKKYIARIKIGRKIHHLGVFSSLWDAKLVRQQAEQKYW